jgi:hypothetical protein
MNTKLYAKEEYDRIFKIKQGLFKKAANAREKKDTLAEAYYKTLIKKFDISTRKYFE